MKTRHILPALGLTAIASLGLAQRADATEAHVKVAAMAECQGYVITVNGTDFTGPANIGLWGDASSNQGEIVGGGITPGSPSVAFAYRRTPGHYEGGVTLYFADGRRSSATYAFDVPTCPSATSQETEPATTTTAAAATTTTSSPAATTTAAPSETTTSTTRAAVVGPALGPIVPPSVDAISTSIELPRTGGDLTLALVAAGLFAVGVLLCLAVVVGPRPTRK